MHLEGFTLPVEIVVASTTGPLAIAAHGQLSTETDTCASTVEAGTCVWFRIRACTSPEAIADLGNYLAMDFTRGDLCVHVEGMALPSLTFVGNARLEAERPLDENDAGPKLEEVQLQWQIASEVKP